MGQCETVTPIIDEYKALSQDLEDKLTANIKELADSMARGILKNPKIGNITEVIREHVLALGADITSTTLNHFSSKKDNILPFNPKEKSKGIRNRTLSTILGPVSYEREAFYNKEKNKLSFPADDRLDITAGQLQPDMLTRVVKLGIETPFHIATELSESLMGVKISEGSIHNAVMTAGQHAVYEKVVPSTEEINRKLDELKESNKEKAIHIVVGIDGAMEPLRPQEALRKGKRGDCFRKECKGFRAFVVIEGKAKIEPLASWQQISNDDELGKHLSLFTKSILERPEPGVVTGDGAKWIWNQVEHAFKSRKKKNSGKNSQKTYREVLDWYHAIEHFSGFADVQYSGNKEQKKEWLDHVKFLLLADQISEIIKEIENLSYSGAMATKHAGLLINYLETNKERMNYGTLKREKLTIGSGGIEAANKSVSHIRLKRGGSWWKESHANEVLRLRCAKVNGTLDNILTSCWSNE